MRSIPVITLAVLLLSVSCNKDDKSGDTDLNISRGSLLIGENHFENFPDDPKLISAAYIAGDTLTITFGASCCSGSSWIVNLIGNEKVLYSLPPQREIRLSLKNDELCEAFCTRSVKFDITPARVPGSETIILNLSGWETKLVYNY